MGNLIDAPALFLGPSDFFRSSGAPFPVGGIDLFQLSQNKTHIVYPGVIKSNVWVFLVREDYISEENSGWSIKIKDPSGSEFGKVEREVW